jgi:hypothetical protein
MFQTLLLDARPEAQRGDADGDPGELVADADDVLEPGP